MAPTLNCTVGDPAANSYVCLDEAEEIAANIPGGAEWIALSGRGEDLQPDRSDKRCWRRCSTAARSVQQVNG